MVENNLTGCLTIFKSEIENLKVIAKNIHCEDAVNFINSSGNVKEIIIKNSISDAIDADFSEIVFENVIIDNSQNDCFDVSFGNYSLLNGNFKNCGDKAISVGEKSTLHITNVYIEDSNTGIASKDSAFVKVKNLDALNVEYCLSAYNKKQEFFGGKLMVDKFNCENYVNKMQKDKLSIIKIQNNL